MEKGYKTDHDGRINQGGRIGAGGGNQKERGDSRETRRFLGRHKKKVHASWLVGGQGRVRFWFRRYDQGIVVLMVRPRWIVLSGCRSVRWVQAIGSSWRERKSSIDVADCFFCLVLNLEWGWGGEGVLFWWALVVSC